MFKISTQQTIPRRLTCASAPLSFAQQRLWFLDQLEPGVPLYNLPRAFRIRGQLDVAVLEKSVNELVRRHESLRTTFSIVEGQPAQIIAASLRLSLRVVDLANQPKDVREAEALRLVSEESGWPFDLCRGPLVRVTLLSLDHDDYILLLTMHHIVSDGWSMGVLYRELLVLYRAFSRAQPSSLPDLPVQYADFSVWQRDWLQGEILESQLSYWKTQLQGSPTVLNLPLDRPRPAVQSYRGARQSIVLSEGLLQSLKALSRREGVTLFMVLMAAFQALLHRYSGQDDIIIGSPIANRNHLDIEGLIGFFVNTLVLRTNLSGNPTFTQLLARVREVALGAYAHQDLPFEKLVEELQPERSLSHSPLFEVLFVLQNASSRRLEIPGLILNPINTNNSTAKFTLMLNMHEEAHGLKGSLEYATDLFNATTIERMLSHFQNLLEAIGTNPGQHLSELPMLTTCEKHQLLMEWNDTSKDYPSDKCIHELFEAQVEQIPDAIAVVFEDQQLSYRELNNRANQLAHYLREQGVGPDVPVGICIGRSIEMVVGLLGILKAGGAYVPLDPSYPKDRVRFMLEDTHTSVVLTDIISGNDLPQTGARALFLDRDWDEIAKGPQINLQLRNVAQDLAYIIYTSGSTGLPKGVEACHRGIVRLLFGVDYAQFDSAQTILQLAPISFDAATFEIWGSLLHGGKCVLYPENVPSAQELGNILKRHQVTMLWLTAALFNTVIDQAPEALSDIKQLLIGGEALSVSHVKKALAQLPNTKIVNGYGPTESTTFACSYPIPHDLDDSLSSIPIGKPIGNTQVYILDPHLKPVPIGVSGELYIGGDGLARGYLNRPELTAEKFIANPFSSDPQARLYKTGDLARYLPTGNIDFFGRLDDQVKIRGYRIELGEIEAALGYLPSIRESVVLTREINLEKQLVAYVVAAPGFNLSANDLRVSLQQKLPEYMVPSAFVFLDKLPLTPNGKLDRKTLPKPDQRSTELDENFAAPRTPAEKILASVWAGVLNLSKVGVNDNFFHLGGHSLLATQVMSRITQYLKIDLPLRKLFENPTIAELAKVITMQVASQTEPSDDRILSEIQALSDEEFKQLMQGHACDLSRA